MMNRCTNRLAAFLTYLRISDEANNIIDEWNSSHYPYQYYQPYEPNGFDSGWYAVTILYYIVYSCPVYFSQHQMVEFRRTFCYWVMKSQLPI